MPPSATAASASRCEALAASSAARAAAVAGRGAEDGGAEGAAAVEGAAAGWESGSSMPGNKRARAWPVSKLTVRATAACPPPAVVRPSSSPAARSRMVSVRAADLACSENGGSAGALGFPGLKAMPRLTTTRARQTRSAMRGMSSRRRFCLVSSFTTDHFVMVGLPAGNPVHHGARKIARLVHTTSSSGRRPAS